MWTYELATGKLYFPDGSLLAVGYSGDPADKNNPLDTQQKDHGPIPVGLYTIGAPVDDPHGFGSYGLPLTPDIENVMYGRDDFYMHGDSIEKPGTASEGCIIQPLFARQRVWQSGDNLLRVVA